jgi:hypothetical protein
VYQFLIHSNIDRSEPVADTISVESHINVLDLLEKGQYGICTFPHKPMQPFAQDSAASSKAPLSAPSYQDHSTKNVEAEVLIPKANSPTLWYTHLDEDVGRLNSF